MGRDKTNSKGMLQTATMSSAISEEKILFIQILLFCGDFIFQKKYCCCNDAKSTDLYYGDNTLPVSATALIAVLFILLKFIFTNGKRFRRLLFKATFHNPN